jgi:hypothetical protein
MPFTAWLASAETAPPSFASGFGMLNTLGPAEPAEGTPWRRVSAGNPSGNSLLNGISQKMQGNGWLVATAEDGKIRAVHFGQVLPVETEPPGAAKPSGGGLLGKLLGGAAKDAEEPAADLDKDVALIVSTVAKLKTSEDPDDFSKPWNANGSQAFGPLLLFAAQLHRTGHPELADRLAWTLFKAAPTRETVVDAALNSLGDQLYQDIAGRFFTSWDWLAYRDELATLVEKLPRGWETRPAAALVLDSLALRLGGNPPPDPRASGVELDVESLAAIAWMLDTPKPDDSKPPIPPELQARLQHIPPEYHAEFLESMGMDGGGTTLAVPSLWLLKKPDESESLTGPAGPLLRLGVRALPVLAALTADRYPVCHRNPASRSRSYSYQDNAIERALAIHASMARPATRGDIARTLLLATLPDANGDLQNTDADTLREIAVDFHKTHHGKDWGGLAAVFLAEGAGHQKAEAAKLLATSTEAAHHQLFETLILESSPAAASLSQVMTYAQQRKTAAKPFIDRYLALVRDEIGDASNLENNRELSWELRQPGHLTQMLRQLESLASGKSPQASARELAKGSVEEAKAGIPALFQSLSTEKPQTQLAAMLAGAVAADAPETRGLFLNLTFRVGWARGGGEAEEEEEDDDEKQATDRKFSESEANAWKKLIADERPLPKEMMSGYYNFGGTLGDLAASAAEYAISPQAFQEFHIASVILEESIASLCRQRVNARFAGESLPPLPDAEKTTPERLKEIVATAGAKPAGEIIEYLGTLSPDERAAWFMWINDPGDPPLPESVRKLGMTIIRESLVSQNGITPEPGLLNLKAGMEIHEDTFDPYIASLAADAAKHSLTFGTLQRADFPPGLASWTVRAAVPETKTDEEENEEPDPYNDTPSAINIFRNLVATFELDGIPENATALIIAHCYTDENNGDAMWWIVDGKPVPFAIDDEGELQTKPEPVIPGIIAAAREAGTGIMLRISVITRADAERIGGGDF